MANLKFKKAWDIIPESQATPESRYNNRREFLAQMGLLAPLAGAGWKTALAAPAADSAHVPEQWSRQWSGLFPAARNTRFQVERSVTPEQLFTSYNNFYEFSTDKQRVRFLVDGFEAHPWEIDVAGQVEKPGKYDLDSIIRMGSLEERLYHFRCVEAWSANVPWTGYPLKQFIEKVKPTAKAKFVRFVTVLRPAQMPGQKVRSYPWPYYEAISMEEAMNDLALLTFGLYGHPLNKQNGAPVRMILPWKYGFKSIKSIVRIDFTEKRPGTLWGDISREYGFWANTNPKYDHPRWSQASERFLNDGSTIPTKIYNGYGEYVAHLYEEGKREYYF